MDTRIELTSDQRAVPLRHTIDPGFVHYRKIQTTVGPELMTFVDEAVRSLPANLPDGLRTVRMDHIYNHVALDFCATLPAPPLEALLAKGNGRIFCSTETLEGNIVSSDGKRAISRWVPRGHTDLDVELHYSTEHIHGDTLCSILSEEGEFEGLVGF